MTDSESKRSLLPEDQFLIISGLSEKGLRLYEKDGFIKPVKRSEGTNYYSEESADLAKAMMLSQGGRSANLQEAYQMALQGISSKKRRSEQSSQSNEGDRVQRKAMDPKKIERYSEFEDGLPRGKDLLADITNDMGLNGFRPSDPIYMGTWPGQDEPVIIDGHTRRLAAIAAGIQQVPVVIEEFDSLAAAWEQFVKSQILRRPTDQWVRYRLAMMHDRLMDRGGDRRSEPAKSKGPNGPIETSYPTSAERTAALVGWTPRMVKRARRISKEVTPEILEALKKMTISGAEKEIAKKAKLKTGKQTDEKPLAANNQDAMVRLTDENLAALKELGGNRHSHVNRAVEEYVARHREKDGSEAPEKAEERACETVTTDEESPAQES